MPTITAKTVNPEFDSDVLVVGGGPAGATAAYYMALAGLRVIVLDQDSFPREKVCGDFVSPGSLRELKKMGITDNPAFNETNIVDQAVIYLSGKELVSGKFPAVEDMPRYSRIISRKLLDNWILTAAQTAGARVIEGLRVTGFRVENDGVTVTATQSKETHAFRARLLVGADGNNSIVARILQGKPSSPLEKALVARGYFEEVTGLPNEANVFYGNDSFPGYSWLFPTCKGEANVGVGLVLGATPPAEEPKALLAKLINSDEGMRKRLEHAKLKGEVEVCSLNLHDKQASIVGDRVMLVGEAAGLVNPFNGEGIQFALKSGRWAAEVAAKCNGNFSEQALGAYKKRVDEELGYGFNISALLLGLLRNRNLLGLLRNRNLNYAWLRWIEIMGEKSKTDPEYARLTSGILSGMIFPNEQATAQALMGTLEEAALSVGVRTVGDLLKEPTKVPQAAISLAQSGLELAQYAAQDPLSALLWAMDAATKVVEVGAKVAEDQVKVTINKKQPES